jgi:DNA-binding PadR family transcriptional regulator
MFDKILQQIQKGPPELKQPKKTDLPILKVLFEKGNLKQYALEKHIKKHEAIPHSTVTSKLERLYRDGYINFQKEKDGLKYYEITPLGAAVLVASGEISFQKLVEYFKQRPLDFVSTIAAMQPNLKDNFPKMPAFYVDQLTQDLWMIYYIANRTDLRRETLQYFLDPSQTLSSNLSLQLQVLCAPRVEIEGKGICLKERKECPFRPKEISKCNILRKEMESEFKQPKETIS